MPCSDYSFISCLKFLEYSEKLDGEGNKVPLKDLDQADIYKAWENFYKKDSDIWKDAKNLYNLEKFIDENDAVHAMRSFMVFGFPIKVKKDPKDHKSEVVRYKNLLDGKLDQKTYISNF